MKKKREKKPIFIIGKKIKEIKIDKIQYMKELAFAVSVFAILLAAGAISLAMLIKYWFSWVISGVLIIYFLSHTAFFIIKTSRSPKYVLCENCLVVNSIWHFDIVELSKITNMKTKNTIFDGADYIKKASLVVYYQDKSEHKITLHSITENVPKLITVIEKQKESYIKSKEKSGI